MAAAYMNDNKGQWTKVVCAGGASGVCAGTQVEENIMSDEQLVLEGITYHCGRKRYVINSDTFSTCSQHLKFTLINFQECHARISYMGRYLLTCWGTIRM